jgi:hypothetical protein
MPSKFTKQLFVAAMGDFFDSYGAKFNPESNPLAYSAWYDYLSENLEESELIPALRTALVQFEFRPSPKQVIEAFKGSREVFALEEWQICLNASKTGQIDHVLLSPQGEKALTSIGGFSRLAIEEPSKLHSFVSKEFVSRWLMYERALISGAIAPPPKMLKPEQAKEATKEEFVPASKESIKEFKEKWLSLVAKRKLTSKAYSEW